MNQDRPSVLEKLQKMKEKVASAPNKLIYEILIKNIAFMKIFIMFFYHKSGRNDIIITRNYIGLEIRLKNLATSWKRICVHFMTLPEDRAMNCGKYRISE
jgi:hypothetical protein